MPFARTRHRSVDADEVVAAAVEVAFELGLHAVDADRVSSRLGVAPRVVAAACPSFPDVVAAAFNRIVSAELAEVKRVVLAHPSPVTQLRALLDTLAEPVRVEVDSVWLESWSLGRRCPELGAAVRAEEGAWHAFIASVVRRGVRSGDFLPVDPDDVAAQVLAMIDGVNAYSLVGFRSDLDRRRLLHSIARAHLGAAVDAVEPSAAAAV